MSAAPRCRNCGHSDPEHPGGLRCTQVTETTRQRTECSCPAFNVRPRVLRPVLTDTERARVVAAEINDLDRQIAALQQRRSAAARLLAGLTAAAPRAS